MKIRKIVLCLTVSLFVSGQVFATKSKSISVAELKDKIAGAWVGQMIGNIYGLPHENKYVNAPGPENFPYGYTKNIDKLKQCDGAFSDDDTDIEYFYLLQMQKHGIEPSYEQLREAWMYHIRDRVWLANRATLGLMHFGYTPPFTGMKSINPHWYQIDPQLINEIWAYTAPGMVKYAAQKSDWAARITSDEWGVEPTIHYGAMYAAAFFEKDIKKLIEIGLKELPQDGRYANTVRDMIALHKKYPKWQDAWKEMAQKYYVDEPDMTKTIWNANLNGACAILAMLYGKGDFQYTLDLSCAMGFDADNQAATLSGLLGVINGLKGLPKDLYLPVEDWKEPFNDKYINITRFDIPDSKISDIISNTTQMAIKLVEQKGGKLVGQGDKAKLIIKTEATFNPPLEFCVGPNPRMEVGKKVDYDFYCTANKSYKWTLAKGNLPNGIEFKNGKISGVPSQAGVYPVTLQLSDGKKNIQKEFKLLVRNENIAAQADSIIANVHTLNTAVLDSCWYTFGQPMYAKSVNVINDGILNGEGSVFYSLAAKTNLPKVDYYGYAWKQEKSISMVALNIGCMEEFGGWFMSLNVQYQNEEGKWLPVEKTIIEPALPKSDIVFIQPHFVEYVISFNPVKTKAIRIIGDAAIQNHWHKYTKNVSGFTSVTELSVY
ncbi:ADP-ribosylglycohydrolase family protein [Dysgonomonas sp.]|nr:ADP-ribosylglycohydrolase family protein [Dysgonomonas sp.]